MNKYNDKSIEILAPAGGPESLLAAVRCGADAVYLGGPSLNARRGAANFDRAQLVEAVSYCHARNTRVYLAVNTAVFDDELTEAARAVETACEAGVDALIIQDLAVARIARDCAPALELHASTQMSIHNLPGVQTLEALGFSRVVIARELSRGEITEITGKTRVQTECFVHGALCMSVSGGCYLSSMIGGRSGNRGLCAQPCRLPFASGGSEAALSLRDLSLIGRIAEMREAGIVSLKIEGRLKRPEYVAAAVTACKAARNGETPDLETLAAVFSRSGFTDGYFTDRRGDTMFGVRRKEDVVSAAPVLKVLANLYKAETPRVPVSFALEARGGVPVALTASDGAHEVTARGGPPQEALTTPTTPERARAALEKTGGTPFFLSEFTCHIGDGLMLPASALNALRREVLDGLLSLREAPAPHPYTPFCFEKPEKIPKGKAPAFRIRLAGLSQYHPEMSRRAEKIIFPLCAVEDIPPELTPDKVMLELPRVHFGESAELEAMLERAKVRGYTDVLAGNFGGIGLARRHGLAVCGDFTLNLTNSLALEEFSRLGLSEMTASFECSLARLRELSGGIPLGAVCYGYLPLMVTRNRPAGMEADEGYLTDRLDTRFLVRREGDIHTLYNSVPLWLFDRLNEFSRCDFLTLYFTRESAAECLAVLHACGEGAPPETKTGITRGLYYRNVQ